MQPPNLVFVYFAYFVVPKSTSAGGTTKYAKYTKIGGAMDIVYGTESYAIMGACFEVYKEKGCGFLEAVYQECLEMELGNQRIP